ncbi:Predicted arabinose efflux permease, MFS family [Rhizobium sp. NFR07]|uniref:MFS transporter n=1 Tax=Rhizobium sp. NFR07 TaxID=1566262 RepID=UPI0008F01619|nr:MFS transporter [Rhizobium sp. NFR07]SFB64510.1 Predicted arabinose efflux permease, MFS family [Rhizobium sp. NFR07]
MSKTVAPAASSGPTRMTVFSFLGAVMISACSSAPTPLYHLYQETLHLTPGMITLVFGSYAFALLAALLTVGGLSDFLGRRPLILLALLLNATALVIFLIAQSGPTLLAARIVQGLATGVAFPTFGATILDTNREKAPLLNGITAFLGLTIGSLLGGILVDYAPYPTHLVYVVLLGLTGLAITTLFFMPETISQRPGAIASLRPHVSVPRKARSTLLRVTPVNVAGWSLGGFYLSLMPTLVTVATGIVSPFVGASVVATLMLSGTASVLIFRKLPAQRVLLTGTAGLIAGVLITLSGVHLQAVTAIFVGTATAGLGFGSIFSNILRILLPLAETHERAELFAAFLIESYLAFALPAILAGFAAPVIGLQATIYVYGAAVILLALISMTVTRTNLSQAPALT